MTTSNIAVSATQLDLANSTVDSKTAHLFRSIGFYRNACPLCLSIIANNSSAEARHLGTFTWTFFHDVENKQVFQQPNLTDTRVVR